VLSRRLQPKHLLILVVVVVLAAGIFLVTRPKQVPRKLPPVYAVPSFYESLGSTAAVNCAGNTWTDANSVFAVLIKTASGGSFTLSYNGSSPTSSMPYNDNLGDILTQLQTLPGLSGVSLVPDANMPDGQTNDPTDTLDSNGSVWFFGVPDFTLLTESGAHLKIGARGLTDVIQALPDGTEVDFQTNGCYEVEGGLMGYDGGPSITYNGNPGNGPTVEDAVLYDSDNTDDGVNQPLEPPQLDPILQQSPNDLPITIEHLQLIGSDGGGAYSTGVSDNAAGIMLQGTQDVTINDVSVIRVWGDGITFLPGQGSPNTNTVVENFSATATGRIGISPTSNNGLLVCGVSLGAGGLGGDSWDFENDFQGNGQYARNVTITGTRCVNSNSVTGTVYAQGCYMTGGVVINNLVTNWGPLLFNGCSMTTGSNGLLQIIPGGAAVTADPETQRGQVIFSHDQFVCPAGGLDGTCIDDWGPWNVTIKGSTFMVGGPGSPETVWNSLDQFIPVNSPIPSGSTVKWLYKERNTGSDPLVDITVTPDTCTGAVNWESGGSTSGNSPSMSAPDNELLPGGEWTYSCVEPNVTATETDSATATGTDVTTMTSVPMETTSATVLIHGGGPGTTTTTQAPTGFSNLNESALAKFGAQLYLDSDCINGDLNGSAPYGSVSTFSTYVNNATTFLPGSRHQCPLKTNLQQAPSVTTVVHGNPVTDTAIITGAIGGAQPVGSLDFYVCGQTSVPQPCTSQTTLVGAVSLTTGASITSSATSPSFTPPSPGTYCFAVYYSQTNFSAGGSYYLSSSDQSGPTTEIIPGGVPGIPYDGCFTAT
jgi:hypothetical protein